MESDMGWDGAKRADSRKWRELAAKEQPVAKGYLINDELIDVLLALSNGLNNDLVIACLARIDNYGVVVCFSFWH